MLKCSVCIVNIIPAKVVVLRINCLFTWNVASLDKKCINKECLDVPTYFVPNIKDTLTLYRLVYSNLTDNFSLKGPGRKVENGKSTNEISHISSFRYVIIEQTLVIKIMSTFFDDSFLMAGEMSIHAL